MDDLSLEIQGLKETQAALEKALKDGYAPKCNDRENWGGIRCQKKYCPVYEICEEMGD